MCTVSVYWLFLTALVDSLLLYISWHGAITMCQSADEHNTICRNVYHVAHVLVPLRVNLCVQNTNCGSLIKSLFHGDGIATQQLHSL